MPIPAVLNVDIRDSFINRFESLINLFAEGNGNADDSLKNLRFIVCIYEYLKLINNYFIKFGFPNNGIDHGQIIITIDRVKIRIDAHLRFKKQKILKTTKKH